MTDASVGATHFVAAFFLAASGRCTMRFALRKAMTLFSYGIALVMDVILRQVTNERVNCFAEV